MITKATTVWCDDPGCANWEEIQTNQIAVARKALNKLGWYFANGKDYCGDH